MKYPHNLVAALTTELFQLGNQKRAIGAQAYMKDIAPFIGVATPERRALVKKIAQLHGNCGSWMNASFNMRLVTS
jgi:hypothetical protein